MPKKWKFRIHLAADTRTKTACNKYIGETTTNPALVTCGQCIITLQGRPYKPHQDLDERFWSKVNKDGPLFTDPETGEVSHCWEWQAYRDPAGYGKFRYKGKTYLAHRFAYQLTHGFLADDKCLLHRCDNPPCVNPAHVFNGTRPENTLDMLAKGRMTRGSQRRNSKLTEPDVRDIKRRLRENEPQTEIARDYPVDQSVISDIKRERLWKHVR